MTTTRVSVNSTDRSWGTSQGLRRWRESPDLHPVAGTALLSHLCLHTPPHRSYFLVKILQKVLVRVKETAKPQPRINGEKRLLLLLMLFKQRAELDHPSSSHIITAGRGVPGNTDLVACEKFPVRIPTCLPVTNPEHSMNRTTSLNHAYSKFNTSGEADWVTKFVSYALRTSLYIKNSHSL